MTEMTEINFAWAMTITVMLSFLFAAAELFSKFKDEPFLILKYPTVWLYIVFNMSIAGIALKMILMTGMFPSDPMGFLKAALTAGLGSPALMRSKWLKITISGKETAIGPEIIINIFLETLEKQIDRSRAIDRKKLVEDCMTDIDFKKAKAYTVTTMIAASQTDTAEAVKNVIDESEKIAGSQMEDEEKSLALGYLVLDKMGEKFLRLLFHDKNRGKYTRKSQP